jgi:glycosyltransferase involved in cell wall biosynthesis
MQRNDEMKLNILSSHPVHYHENFFRNISQLKGIDLEVYYCWKISKENRLVDKEFGKNVDWGIEVLSGYSHRFLKNFSLNPSSDFWGQVNPGIIMEIVKKRKEAFSFIGWNSMTAILGILTSILLGVEFYFRGESPLSHELLKGKIKRFCKKLIFSELFKFASGFFYIGEENRKFYRYFGVPEDKLFFTPYAVDNERFFKESEILLLQKEEIRNKIGIKKDARVILFLGKLIRKKRPMDLLRAYENLDLKNKTIIFIGDGVLRGELEGYVRANNLMQVHFTGFKNQKEIYEYYAAADVFVLPSGIGETWGLVINEAMCFGLPIIASDTVGCVPDLVHHEHNGFVYKTGSVAELSKRMYELVANEEKRKKFGKNSLEIIKKYNFKSDAEMIIKALNLVRQKK